MIEVKISDYLIGPNQPPFIAAEAGINHNGEIKKALEMIHVAKKAGADAVKFQTFKAHEVVMDSNLTYTYKSQGKEITESMLEMFKRCEFSRDEWFQIRKECEKEQILFLSTPQNPSDLELLLEMNISAIKVGSDDFTNLPLLKNFSATGLPLILSCGMADSSEVIETLSTIGATRGYPTILLLTTSQYPTPPEDVNILKLQTLSKEFPMIPLGFSDHTQDSIAASMAVAFGACFFEKHFTLDHNLPGPDHWFSADNQGLKNWITTIRKSSVMLGSRTVKPTLSEEKMKILARRSLVAIKNIAKGDLLSEENIGFRRPGNGIPPSRIDDILGKNATKHINKGSLLKFGDFR